MRQADVTSTQCCCCKDSGKSCTLLAAAGSLLASLLHPVFMCLNSLSVVSRDQPTPLAYMLMKVMVDPDGTVTTELNRRFSATLEVRLVTIFLGNWGLRQNFFPML